MKRLMSLLVAVVVVIGTGVVYAKEKTELKPAAKPEITQESGNCGQMSDMKCSETVSKKDKTSGICLNCGEKCDMKNGCLKCKEKCCTEMDSCKCEECGENCDKNGRCPKCRKEMKCSVINKDKCYIEDKSCEVEEKELKEEKPATPVKPAGSAAPSVPSKPVKPAAK